jgi:erythronate-4-phosphate dehydrogenase
MQVRTLKIIFCVTWHQNFLTFRRNKFRMIKIIADDKIPFLKGVLEPYSDITYLPGSMIGKDQVKEADALLIRTRTKCTENLLKGSRVSFIGTATIGFDHIDTRFCESKNIIWTNAPGCNSSSVQQKLKMWLRFWE